MSTVSKGECRGQGASPDRGQGDPSRFLAATLREAQISVTCHRHLSYLTPEQRAAEMGCLWGRREVSAKLLDFQLTLT